MALCFQISPSLIKSQFHSTTSSNQISPRKPFNFITIRCSSSEENANPDSNSATNQQKKLSHYSSWESKDSEGKDYLYRLGAEAYNMNIAVGASAGVIDDIFTGNFIGKDADIVIDYRQKVTRSFEYLQGDNYIAPVFMLDMDLERKRTRKSFSTRTYFMAMGVEPIIMSAGKLESEKAGPGKLIREQYRTASQVVKNQGKLNCLMINYIDAGLGRFGNTQMTVNNQIVVGTLMNIASLYNYKALDFYGALRSRTYDRSILKWVNDARGAENLGTRLLKQKNDAKLPQTLEGLLESGYNLIKEQKLIMETKLSKEYMKNMDDYSYAGFCHIQENEHGFSSKILLVKI